MKNKIFSGFFHYAGLVAAFVIIATFTLPYLSSKANAKPQPAALIEQVTEQAPLTIGMAHPKQLNFQPAATDIMDKLHSLHNMLLVIIFSVSIFVLLVLLYIIVKFNAKKNPLPSKTSHNTKLEIIWTTIPIIILIIIAVPSVRAHYFMEKNAEDGITLKVTGHQWYWSYEYPDFGGFGYDSYMLDEKAAQAAGEPRLLGVDNRVVIPVNTPVRVQMTSADVIHSWAMPSFGVKRDAVPGRLNESWFEVKKEGVFYGQCSELCGKLHGFMPIVIEVVSKEKFDVWVAGKQKEAGIDPIALTAKDTGAASNGADKQIVKETVVQEKKNEATKAKNEAEVKPDTPAAEVRESKPETPASDAVTSESN